MTSANRAFYVGVLVLLGAGWGITMPLTKIAVSTGYQHFGLIFWQMTIGTIVMTMLGVLTGRRLPCRRDAFRVYVIIALIGSVLPNTASYQAAVHLPAGILSILLSMIPIWAFPIALVLALDRFEFRRLFGLCVGLAAVLLIALPDADFSGDIRVVWILVALISGLFYAFEGNYVARWGTAELDPLQVLWGASLTGALISLPLALGSGQWISPLPPYGAADVAQVLNATLHVVVYTGYVWLVGKAGPVFAVQISYLVTLFGVFWARLILNEAYAATVWLALCLMMFGMYLVQPRKAQLEADAAMGNTQR